MYKKSAGIQITIMINPYIDLGRTDAFTVLNGPIHEHGMPLCLFLFPLINFIIVLQFSACESCRFCSIEVLEFNFFKLSMVFILNFGLHMFIAST